MDEFESQHEVTAYQQQAMDLLYTLGCQYDISEKHMRELCELALVPYDDLLKYSGKPVTCKTDIFN